jgi:hypothetical protein
MSSSEIFGWLATLAAGFSYLAYFVSTVRGRSRPSRMTWFILAALSVLAALSYYEVGATATFGAVVACAIGSSAIAIASIYYGDGGWQPIDLLTFTGVLFVGAIWYATGSPFLALISSLSVDFIALIPTVSKVRKRPDTEELMPWLVTLASNFLNILALDLSTINQWKVDLAVYPFYMLIVNGLVVFLIAMPKFRVLEHGHKRLVAAEAVQERRSPLHRLRRQGNLTPTFQGEQEVSSISEDLRRKIAIDAVRTALRRGLVVRRTEYDLLLQNYQDLQDAFHDKSEEMELR